MGIKVITPASQQITTADLRAHCRIDPIDEDTDAVVDAQLVAFLAAAVDYAQHFTQRSIGAQTLELALDAFPADAIALERGPVTSIAAITYLDPEGVEQTLSSSAYALDDYGLVCAARLAPGESWPATQAGANAVKVRYVAGVAATGAARLALLLTVSHLNENREATGPAALATLPLGVDSLLDTLKVWEV